MDWSMLYSIVDRTCVRAKDQIAADPTSRPVGRPIGRTLWEGEEVAKHPVTYTRAPLLER